MAGKGDSVISEGGGGSEGREEVSIKNSLGINLYFKSLLELRAVRNQIQFFNFKMDDINRVPINSVSNQQASNTQNPASFEAPVNRTGHRLEIWFLVLGIVVGVVAMWAFDSFYRIPNKLGGAIIEEITRVKAEIIAENTAQEFSVSGSLMEIDEDDGTLSLNLGFDNVSPEGEEPRLVGRIVTFTFDQNTLFRIKDSESGELVETDIDGFFGQGMVTVRTDQPIKNLIHTYYAQQVTLF